MSATTPVTSPATTDSAGVLPRGSAARLAGGYSLIEVMVASALLATVLLAIVTLFVMGGERIKSGKELTKATANGMDIMEEFRAFPFDNAYKVINGKCQGGCDTTKTWKTTDTTPDLASDGGWAAENVPSADYRKILQRWKDDVEKMFAGHGGGASSGVTEVRVDGFRSVPANTTTGDTCFCDARFLRIRVTVKWREVRDHRRNVTFETLKF